MGSIRTNANLSASGHILRYLITSRFYSKQVFLDIAMTDGTRGTAYRHPRTNKADRRVVFPSLTHVEDTAKLKNVGMFEAAPEINLAVDSLSWSSVY